MKFKTVARRSPIAASGILFNVKPNGDWLTLRYNDTEHNVVMWEFHNGIRGRSTNGATGPSANGCRDRETWHELKMTSTGGLQGVSRRRAALDYTLGSTPGPQRSGAPPNPDLVPPNNPVLQPPIRGKVGLWSKTDSTSEFKDYVVTHVK